MFNKVILTFGTRILTAVLSVVNVLIGTNYLGVEGFGTISLIVLGITIYLMIQNLITGSSIVYFISKFNPASILTLSYVWALISILLFGLLIVLVNYLGLYFNWSIEIVPAEYILHNILLAGGYGFMAIHLNILLGRERIKAYNFIFLFQHTLASLLLVLFFVILNKNDLFYYLISLYISYFSSFIVAFVFTRNYIKSFKLPTLIEFKSMLRYGILGQSANIFQLLNYRLSYYLIDIFVGRAALGVFSAATQISEGLWIFGKSIATVQFAHISNKNDVVYARNLSLRLVKFTGTITIFPLLVLMILPFKFYTTLLGDSFEQTGTVIRYLALGTLALTVSVILSTYFSGTGSISRNTRASGLGVIITILFGFTLVPLFGIIGAAATSSLAYLISLIYLLYFFNKEIKTKWRNWILTLSDFKDTLELIRMKIKKKKEG